MKIATFTYTKPNGEISTRTLVAQVVPTEGFYAGIDVSEMDADTLAAFVEDYAVVQAVHVEAMKSLQERFDVKHNYRKFLTERMSNLMVSGI